MKYSLSFSNFLVLLFVNGKLGKDEIVNGVILNITLGRLKTRPQRKAAWVFLGEGSGLSNPMAILDVCVSADSKSIHNLKSMRPIGCPVPLRFPLSCRR